jgi:hypothetical protein
MEDLVRQFPKSFDFSHAEIRPFAFAQDGKQIHRNVLTKISSHNPVSTALSLPATCEPNLSDTARAPNFITLQGVSRNGIDDCLLRIFRKSQTFRVTNELRQLGNDMPTSVHLI